MSEEISNFEKNAKALFKKLGIKPEKIEAETFEPQTFVESWKADFKKVALADDFDNARRAGVTEALIKAQKQVVAKMGLDPQKYKAMDKGQWDAVLEDIAAMRSNDSEPPKENTKASDELRQNQELLSAANKRLKELQKQVEELPTQLEAAKKEGYRGAKKEAVLSKNFNDLKGFLSDTVTDMAQDILENIRNRNGIDIDITETGEAVVKIKQADGTYQPARKSETEFYKSAAEYFIDKGLIPEKMRRTAPPAANTNVAPVSNQQATTVVVDKATAIINPAFAKFLEQ